MYTRLARGAYGEMIERYPELKGRLAWGGGFGASRSNKAPDLMHFDIGGERGDPSRYLTNLGPIPGETYGGKQPVAGSQPTSPWTRPTAKPPAWPTGDIPPVKYTENPADNTKVDNRSDEDIAHAKTTSDNDDGGPVPLPQADPRDAAGDAQIPPHLNPTAQLGAETTRKYITPMTDKTRFGTLYGETSTVQGSPGHENESHQAIIYNPQHQEQDPLYGKQTMKHELEHAGVRESIQYQKDLVANSPFALSGGEELRQRYSDIARIEAYGPAAMRTASFREQLRQATTFSHMLEKSLSEKFHMTTDEVKAKVKAYQADVDQAVKKKEEQLHPVDVTTTLGPELSQ
jgi:hypothetical protein